jgi:hypothetical protein
MQLPSGVANFLLAPRRNESFNLNCFPNYRIQLLTPISLKELVWRAKKLINDKQAPKTLSIKQTGRTGPGQN